MKKLIAIFLIGLIVVMGGCIGSTSPASTTSPAYTSSTTTTTTSHSSAETNTSTSLPSNASSNASSLNTNNTEEISFVPVEVNISPRVHVKIDPRMELIEILYFLSNPEWYNREVSPYRSGVNIYSYPYLKDVLTYFENYTNATAVQLVYKVVQDGLTYDAVPEFALHLNPVNFSKDMNWSDMLRLRPDLNTTLLDEFADAVSEFANETDFWRFYNEHRAFYNKTVEEFAEKNGIILNITRFEESFFGENASSWTIIPLTLMSRHGFAYYFDNNGDKRVYAFLGFGSVNNGVPIVSLNGDGVTFLVHEFAHSFVNPAVDNNYALFKPYESLYNPVKEKLSMMAYTDFKIMLYETFVRAVEAYYLNVTGHPDAAKRKLGMNSVAFYFIKDVYNAYTNDYMKHRNEYKTFNDFMPELAKVIGKVYNQTDGGKKVNPPLTFYDFVKNAKSQGVVVAYSPGMFTKQSAENLYRWLLSANVNATIKPVSSLTKEDLKKNLALIIYSNNTLLHELNKNAIVIVNGTKVYSKPSGETYLSALWTLQIIRNPWNDNATVFLETGTNDRVFIYYIPSRAEYLTYVIYSTPTSTTFEWG